MLRIHRAALAVTLLAGGWAGQAGCGGDTASDGGRLRVVATTTQLADFARNVGGERASVTQLLKPGVDPHEYEPTPGDVNAVAAATVVVEHGIGLDDWLDGVVRNAGSSPVRVVATRGIMLRAGDGREPEGDPHVWLDPRNAVRMVRAIEAALALADPAGAATYRSNAGRYVARIEALDAELAERIATIPAARRRIVTAHDAFGYFAARYGITVVGTVVPSLSAAAEPGAKDLAELAAAIRRERVRTVFAEASVDDRLERAIADEAGATVGDPLYGDTLAPAGDPAGTYLGMMRSNMDAILAGIA